MRVESADFSEVNEDTLTGIFYGKTNKSSWERDNKICLITLWFYYKIKDLLGMESFSKSEGVELSLINN